MEDSHLDLLRQQTTLARFGELALRSDDLDTVLTEACRLAAEALDTELAKVVALQEDGLTLLVRAGVGWSPDVVGLATLTASEDTSEGHAFLTGEPVISPDIATETRFKYASFLIENGVRAIANVLIIGGQGRRPFGILQVDSRRPRHFTDGDTAFLRSYANLLAATVERMRINRELRESNDLLEARVAVRTRELSEADARLRSEGLQRARVEDALRQSHKMEAIGQLTGGIAHDFNNMLTAITGSIDLVRKRVKQGRFGEIDRFLEGATHSATRASALTRRLLDFSRQQTAATRPVDANRVIEDLKPLFRQTLGSNIAIDLTLVEESWPVLCDANQLENALLNLVINARDAMPQGGRILISTENSALIDPDSFATAVAAGDYSVIRVKDSGTGMTPEVMSHALEPFFTTKPAGQGTGLGLSMLQGFANDTGGCVRLRSDAGQGLEVSIYLPRHHGPVERPTAPMPDRLLPQPHVNASILVVEPEPAVRIVILDALAERGYKALEAADGRAALELLESAASIDLLLTDLGLPGATTGRDLADMARAQRPHLKVLFVTGAAGDPPQAAGTEIILKPFTIDRLVSQIQGLIDAPESRAAGPGAASRRGVRSVQSPV